MLTRSRNFGLLGAAGGRFGLDFGGIWGPIFAPEARSAILVKSSTAPRREHDFEDSGGCQKGLKMGPKTASDGNPTPKPSWGPFWALLGAPGRAQMEPETAPKTGAKLKPFWGLPWDPPGREVLPPRRANAACLGARGETTEGGT